MTFCVRTNTCVSCI